MYYVAWWSGPTWGEVSDIQTSIETAKQWAEEKRRTECVQTVEILPFDSYERAEEYRRTGK